MYLSHSLHYNFTIWAIADGYYNFEIWAGEGNNMTRLIGIYTISGGDYESFTTFVDDLTTDYSYIGIHATSGGSGNILTIDDISIDMVNKYDLEVTPYRLDTIMMPGESLEFHYVVKNTGYEPLDISMNPINADYFTNIDFYSDGEHTNTFYAGPNQAVSAVCYATLSPDAVIGQVYFLDILITVSCDCVTRMATIWVTAGSSESVTENDLRLGIYPNPSTGLVTIEGSGTVTITNVLGQTVMTMEVIEKETITLDKGIYFVRKNDGLPTKLIVE